MVRRCSVDVIILVFCAYGILAQFGEEGKIWEEGSAAVNPGGGGVPARQEACKCIGYRTSTVIYVAKQS